MVATLKLVYLPRNQKSLVLRKFRQNISFTSIWGVLRYVVYSIATKMSSFLFSAWTPN